MDPFLGEIKLMAFNYPPEGWALCNGKSMNIVQNNALYSLIGIMFGGDGRTTFNLPDLCGRTPLCYAFTEAVGTKAGVETVTLINDNLPMHNHIVDVNTGVANSPKPDSNFLCTTKPDPQYAAGFNAYTATAPNNVMNPGTVSPVGGAQAHNNMQPSLVLNYCIATMGIYPSRP